MLLRFDYDTTWTKIAGAAAPSGRRGVESSDGRARDLHDDLVRFGYTRIWCDEEVDVAGRWLLLSAPENGRVYSGVYSQVRRYFDLSMRGAGINLLSQLLTDCTSR